MDTLVTYELDGRIATITMDDGKVNVLSPAMFRELNGAFDRAATDGAVVVLRGRDSVFSAGFDLKVLRGGGPDAIDLVRAGFELAERLLSFPTPVVVACSGHAVAMGVFLLLAGDYRLGATGSYRIVANEVAIGLTLPLAGVEICRHRLTPAHFDRAVGLAEPFEPATGVEAGFLDRVVDAAELDDAARATAMSLATLDIAAHAATKLRARGPALTAIRAGIETELS